MAEYARVSLPEALDLPCDLFMLCWKNSMVERLMASEAGREYLEDCERYRQTKPDLAGLRSLQARLGGEG